MRHPSKSIRKEYIESVKKNEKKINFNCKVKKHIQKLPKEGYLAKTVQEFYPDLKDIKHDDKNLGKPRNLENRV